MDAIDKPTHSLRNKRQQILDAAMRVFGRVGFFRATVEQIAVEAAVAKGSIYNYFSSKDQMLIDTYLAMIERINAGIATRSAGTDNVLMQMAIMGHCWMSAFEALGDATAVLFDFYASCGPSSSDPRFREIKTRVYDESSVALSRLFAQGTEEGLFKAQLCDPASSARATIAMTEGLVIQWILHNKRFNLMEQTLLQTYVYLNGLLTDLGRRMQQEVDLDAVLNSTHRNVLN